MASFTRIKQIVLFCGDIAIFYGSLWLVLIIRYGVGSELYTKLFESHITAFTGLLPLWIIIFYIAGLYDLGALKNNLLFTKKFWGALITTLIIAIAYFYLVPASITPKRNLALFAIIMAGAAYLWRYAYNGIVGIQQSKERLLLIGTGPTTDELTAAIEQNPQLGYVIAAHITEDPNTKSTEEIAELLKEHQIKTIVIPSHMKKNRVVTRMIYHELARGVNCIDVATLYERTFQKIPLLETEEVWFLENLAEHRRLYATVIAPIEKICALLLLITLSPLLLLLGGLVVATSNGPAIFKQVRVGRYGKLFTLYKFRSMREDAEKHGAQWAAENDTRLTIFGNFLRHTHLDELPQLWNIIRGDLSFVGPRPERPEFVGDLKIKIPYYELRHLANPGITGWAQINYHYGRSVDDAYQKLQYDLYYLKHRSLTLDIAIVLKTLKLLFIKIA